jgi:hypothetical protein
MTGPLSNDGSKDPKQKKMRSFGTPASEFLRLDFSKFGKAADAQPSKARPIQDRSRECTRIVKRLRAITREHRVSAHRIGYPLDKAALGKILAALRAESLGGDPRLLLHHPDAIAAYLRESLYQELLEEPSNILYTTRLGDNTVGYEAMKANFWRECLVELGEQLLGS